MPHDLRRTFITLAEGLDIPHYALKRLVNHADTDVTAGYIVPDPNRLREPMQRITDRLLFLAKIGIEPFAVDNVIFLRGLATLKS